MSPLVLLFDIDGTLVDTGGAGRRAMLRALDAHAKGRDDAWKRLERIAFAGMTDRAIARAGLTAVDLEASEAALDAVLQTYLAHLVDEMSQTPSYTIHPGVQQALTRAKERSACGLGLGTGNLREGARLKLGKGRIYDAFVFGGFGCDHEDRAEILRVGARRGADHLGMPLESCRVVVIGDTPRDIAAAQAIGAECVAVATGRFTVEQLARHEPTHVFADLTVTGALAAVFGD